MANKGLIVVACLVALISSLPETATAQCRLCSPQAAAASKKPPALPITIQVETGTDFAMIGLLQRNQGGTAQLDAATGQRILTGALMDLGGLPVTGTVIVRGEPKAHVAVTFPGQLLVYNSTGGSCQLTSFTTTLKPNPRIGDNGELRFTFGGLLRIDGTATGTFRGSIPITVEYR